MKKIICFVEPKWAFGSIHNSLCKLLYSYGINAELLSWEKEYALDEFKQITEDTDGFVTTPVGVSYLINYQVPLEKIYSVAHGQWDILLGANLLGYDIYHKLAGFGVVSQILKQKAKEFGVPVEPSLIPFGIHFDRFYTKPSTQLSTVAMAGAYQSHNFFGQEIKRGHLVEQSVFNADLIFKKHNFYHYLTMPSFYKTVDCVIMSSSEEGAGLPMMEAAAAGRLCVGTPVGYFEHNGPLGGGVVVPVDETEFVNETSETLNFYKQNSEAHRSKCSEIQEFAREHYDWSKYIDPWVNFLK